MFWLVDFADSQYNLQLSRPFILLYLYPFSRLSLRISFILTTRGS
jgi:hypothetical protein